LKIGDEFVVLSALIDGGPSTVLLQLLHSHGERSWYPAAMFEAVSTRVPRNWVVRLLPDGSLHLAPEAWLRPGFFEGVVDGERNGPAARKILETEQAIILGES
jgi:hypothetical protein